MPTYNVTEIENIINKYLPAEEGFQKRVLEAMNYSFRAGGKRLRPMMMKMVYDMFMPSHEDVTSVEGGALNEVVKNEIVADKKASTSLVGPFMAAIEMIHTYSLIHDDLPALDNDELRRGRPTCHIKYGEDIAILAGDGLLNYAYETAAKAFLVCPGSVAVEKAFCLLASKPGIYGMIGGQTLDVIKSGEKLTNDELEYIYLNKTSALIECAMMIGASLAGATSEAIASIEAVARKVGMAFQVQDDILDIIGNEEILGKPINSDEKNEKFTYVTIYGMDQAKAYVEQTSIEAKTILEGISIPEENQEIKNQLLQLIDSLINREY